MSESKQTPRTLCYSSDSEKTQSSLTFDKTRFLEDLVEPVWDLVVVIPIATKLRSYVVSGTNSSNAATLGDAKLLSKRNFTDQPDASVAFLTYAQILLKSWRPGSLSQTKQNETQRGACSFTKSANVSARQRAKWPRAYKASILRILGGFKGQSRYSTSIGVMCHR